LPIEWKIEEHYKKNKKNKDEVPIKNFRAECREFANKWIDIHIKEFTRLGVKGDWKNYYSTMSYDAEAQIVRELGKFLKEGSLYKGFKPVLWSTVEKTALADAEVEYQDHKSDTIYASFPVKLSNIKELEGGSEVIIWTTTPWTIPANRALAYNENLDYLLIEINDEGDFKNKKTIIADALLESVVKDCSIKDYKKLNKFTGKDFKGTICKHPFFELGYDYDKPVPCSVVTKRASSIGIS
jgi:isoleucyl-tRNA synthetase